MPVLVKLYYWHEVNHMYPTSLQCPMHELNPRYIYIYIYIYIYKCCIIDMHIEACPVGKIHVYQPRQLVPHPPRIKMNHSMHLRLTEIL